jgi:hypothetical protein
MLLCMTSTAPHWQLVANILWRQGDIALIEVLCNGPCMQHYSTAPICSSTLQRLLCLLLVCAVQVQVSKHLKLAKKQVDDVLGGEEAWKNVQKTEGKAPRQQLRQ